MAKTSFEEDLGALLEMAQEVAVRHNKRFSLAVFEKGTGFINQENADITIGYVEPKDKAIIET